jgi:hypothetical protein
MARRRILPASNIGQLFPLRQDPPGRCGYLAAHDCHARGGPEIEELVQGHVTIVLFIERRKYLAKWKNAGRTPGDKTGGAAARIEQIDRLIKDFSIPMDLPAETSRGI